MAAPIPLGPAPTIITYDLCYYIMMILNINKLKKFEFKIIWLIIRVMICIIILKIINKLRYITMSEEECPTLKWGDIIRIHGVNLTKKN